MRGGQPASSLVGSAAGLLSGFPQGMPRTSKRLNSSRAEPADPGLPRTPLGGPGSLALQPVTRQGTAWTKDTRPGPPVSAGLGARMGVSSPWPLGLRRSQVHSREESHLQLWGPSSLCRPVRLYPGKTAWPALPECQPTTLGSSTVINSAASIQTTPTQTVRNSANTGNLVGLLLILF